MSYKEDYANTDGWNAIDASVRLDTAAGRKFIDFLRANGVDTVIRYYASSALPKTLTPEEAKFLSKEGLAIVPVFQDRARKIEDFEGQSGAANARSAMAFAQKIGQPKGSTILFSVDADYTVDDIDGPITDYFRAIKDTVNGAFAIGAYGSGALLARLLKEDLITVPWLSMSRLFMGTEAFFYTKRWFMRQVPAEMKHEPSGIGYDRNVVSVTREKLGAFQVDEAGNGRLIGHPQNADAVPAVVPVPAPERVAEANRFVATEGLRLRRTPNGIILRELTIGEPVVDQGPAAEEGWRQVKVGDTGGVVFGKYLRQPARPAVEALLRAALDEWLRFDKGRADEKADPYYKYIRQMWAAIGEAYDGRSKDTDGQDIPWSAAFISWVVRQAGPAYANFRFAASHSVFVHDAIQARITGRQDKPFWGWRINEQKPEIGDIVHRNRGGGAFSYSYAENHASYSSHSDIIVEVTPDVARVLGGNIGDTVTMSGDIQEYELDAQGFIQPGQKVISLLKNRAGLAT